jgi:hypothetical protein
MKTSSESDPESLINELNTDKYDDSPIKVRESPDAK